MARYKASCHCSSIQLQFEIDTPLEEKEFKECNCTICTVNGYVNIYTPKELVKFIRGEDILKAYSYEPHNRKHKFCPNCGSSILIEPNDLIQDAGKIGINIRTVEGIDLSKLKIIPYREGRARDPQDEMKEWAERKKGL